MALCNSTAQKQLLKTSAGQRACSLPLPISKRSAVVVRANAPAPRVQPPSGVTVPTQVPQVPPPKFGFVANAERINSRACMIGFFALLAVEAITGRGLLEMLGLTVGKGLGIEF